MATPGGVSITGGVALAQAPIQILGQSAVAVPVPADITEDTLATITVPANAMGANGVLRITTHWNITNNANVKTPRIRFSGGAGTIYSTATFASQSDAIIRGNIANRGTTNSQVGLLETIFSSGGSAVNGRTVSAVDTTVSTTIVITGQKAVAGDTLTLESYLVELIPSN
jgi:hypothetical protein